MRLLPLLLVFLLPGCAAVNVKESYRNPDFKQKLDTVTFKWVPAKEYEYKLTYQYYLDRTKATDGAKQHIRDIRNRTPKLLADSLLTYETDIVKTPANYTLEVTPDRKIEIFCSSNSCMSTVNVQLTLKESKTDAFIWGSAIKVNSSKAPYKQINANGKEELITQDTTKEMVDVIIGEWEKYQLLPLRLASPRNQPVVSAFDDPAMLSKSDPNAEKIINWIKENNKWGADAKIVDGVRKDIDSASECFFAEWDLGWGLTKSGKAYRLEWTKNELKIIELSPEDAAIKGYKERSIKFTKKEN